MKIVMLVRNPVSRDARVLREARTLAAAGHQVTVIGTAAAGLPASESREGFHIRRIPIVPAWASALTGSGTNTVDPSASTDVPRRAARRYTGIVRAARDALVTREFARAAEAIRADAYHAHDLNVLAAAARAAKKHRAKLVYDAHEFYPGVNGLTPFDRRRWSFVESRLVKRADACITVSGAIADEMARRYGIEKPVVVRNTPERAERREVEVPDVLRADTDTLLYIGWIARGRGLLPVVRALALLPDRVHLVLLGPERGVFGDDVRARASELGVAERVHFLGATDPANIVALASHATIGLVTVENTGLSYLLSLPNKLFECVQAGLPVLGSDFPEIRALLAERDAGVTCDPSDPAAIARAVTGLLGDRARLARLADNARRAGAELTWESEQATLLAVYERITSL